MEAAISVLSTRHSSPKKNSFFFFLKKSNLRARFSEKNNFTNFRVTCISKERGTSVYWEQKPLEPKILRTLKGLLQQSKSLIVCEPKSGTFLRPPDLEGKFSPGDLTSLNPLDSSTVGLRKRSSGLFKNGGLYSVWSIATASSKIKDDCQIKDICYSLHPAERFMLWKFHLVSFLLSFSQNDNALSTGVKTWGKHLRTLCPVNRGDAVQVGDVFQWRTFKRVTISRHWSTKDMGPLQIQTHKIRRDMKQEDMTFKGRGGWSMGTFGGRNGNGEIIYLSYNLKN